MKILTDKDIQNFPMNKAIDAIRIFFESAKQGTTVTPARHSVTAGKGALTFTIGAELATTATTGFRVYDTYPNRKGTDSDQIVAVYSAEQSQLKGLIIGSKIGAIRTAAINGYAIDILANNKCDTACLIGAGHHASYQLLAMLAVRTPKVVCIYNRTLEKAQQLVDTFTKEYISINFVATEHLQTSVEKSDIVLCATSSSTPVIQSSWLKDGCYVSSIGPKFIDRHELPTDIHTGATIMVSDAPQQIESYSDTYFLRDINAILSLEHAERANGAGYTVFLSSGRSGTEVIVADAIINDTSDNN